MSNITAVSILPSLEKDTSKLRKFHTSKLGTKLGNYNNNNLNIRYTPLYIENKEDIFKAYLRGERQSLEELASKHGKHGKKVGNMSEKPEKLIISDAARFLGVSYKTMDNYLKQGKLPYEWGQGPTGRARFVSMEALEAWKDGRPIPSMEGISIESMESIENGSMENNPSIEPEYIEPAQEQHQHGQPQQQIMPVIDVLQLSQLRQEMDNLRRENEQWRQEFEKRQQEMEARFEQWVKDRDYKLVETMRKMLETQKREWEEEKKKNRPWWRRLFNR